jgi:hypothetical protein
VRIAVSSVVLIAAACTLIFGNHPSRGTPLWPGARFTREDRDRAVRRGLDSMYAFSRSPHFREWGHDLIGALYSIFATSRDPELRAQAWGMGHERALAWRRGHTAVPPDASPDDLLNLIIGNDAAERLGVRDADFHARLRAAAARFTAIDYLGFDPAREAPPADLPKPCRRCGRQNPRGATVCSRCGAKLAMYNRYDLYQDALIDTYSAEIAGMPIGAHYGDVVKWLPAMRPWPAHQPGNDIDYYAGIYTVTHLVYTTNGYSQFLLSPACFPDEFAYLKANLTQAVADRDPETLGEYLDSLRSFGLDFDDPLIRAGFDYLLSVQNADGSWGEMNDPDAYGRYHPTWTAVDGLRDYRWSRVLPCTEPPGAAPAPAAAH